MKLPYLFLLFAITVVSAISCTGIDEPSSPSLAVEGWIDSDGYPVVVLTRSLTPSEKPVDVSDAVVRWGRVTISDGARTEVMTGGPDADMFPPYSYKCFRMKGEPGRTYTIHASCDGMELTAQSTMLPPAKIDTVRFEAISDTMCSATLTFTAPADADTCRFVVYTRVRSKDSRHYPSLLGAVTATGPGQTLTVPVYRGKNVIASASYEPNFRTGDTLDVILARVDTEVFRFWEAYLDEVYFGNNIFLSQEKNLPGNVRGGYGIFSARGTARRLYRVQS